MNPCRCLTRTAGSLPFSLFCSRLMTCDCDGVDPSEMAERRTAVSCRSPFLTEFGMISVWATAGGAVWTVLFQIWRYEYRCALFANVARRGGRSGSMAVSRRLCKTQGGCYYSSISSCIYCYPASPEFRARPVYPRRRVGGVGCASAAPKS